MRELEPCQKRRKTELWHRACSLFAGRDWGNRGSMCVEKLLSSRILWMRVAPAILALFALGSGCDLNPQPLPPVIMNNNNGPNGGGEPGMGVLSEEDSGALGASGDSSTNYTTGSSSGSTSGGAGSSGSFPGIVDGSPEGSRVADGAPGDGSQDSMTIDAGAETGAIDAAEMDAGDTGGSMPPDGGVESDASGG
jgi:hypothetical protein